MAPDTDGVTKTVVVIRHAGTIEYLRKQGYIESGDQLLEHATLDDVRGAHVIGMLPYHMAAEALSMTVVDLEVPPELRGTELSLEQVEEYAVGISTYIVKRTFPHRVRF